MKMELDDKLHVLVEICDGKIVKAFADPHVEMDIVVIDTDAMRKDPNLDVDKLTEFVHTQVEELGLTQIPVADFYKSCKEDEEQ
jgi:hypothetical protein